MFYMIAGFAWIGLGFYMLPDTTHALLCCGVANTFFIGGEILRKIKER
jgi:hypothetical protein